MLSPSMQAGRLFLVAIVWTLARAVNRTISASRSAPTLLPREQSSSQRWILSTRFGVRASRSSPDGWASRLVKIGTLLRLDRLKEPRPHNRVVDESSNHRRNGECGMDHYRLRNVATELHGANEGGSAARAYLECARGGHIMIGICLEVQPPRTQEFPQQSPAHMASRAERACRKERTSKPAFFGARISTKVVLRQLKPACSMGRSASAPSENRQFSPARVFMVLEAGKRVDKLAQGEIRKTLR